MKTINEIQKEVPSILTDDIIENVFISDVFGPFAKLEFFTYAKAIERALGIEVVLGLSYPGNEKSGEVLFLENLHYEELVADRLNKIKIDFLIQTGLMHYANSIGSKVALSPLYEDDILLTNIET